MSLGRVQYCFCPSGWALLSLGRIFVLRDGPFEFFWFTQTSFSVHQKNSKGPSLRTKILPRDNKAQPSGQKQYCTLPRDTKICLFPLEKKRKNWVAKKIYKKNWPWQKKACKKMKKTMKKWIRGPKILSRWSFPFSRSQLPIKEPLTRSTEQGAMGINIAPKLTLKLCSFSCQ